MRRKAIGVALILALFWVPVATAKLSPGVHADPHSPTSTEYAVPLNSARGDNGSSTPKLFGQGITETGTTASGSATTPTAARHAAGHHAAAKHHRVAAAPASSGNPPKSPGATGAPASDRVLHPGSGSGVAWMIGVGVIVLLLGGGGAAVLAIRGRPHGGAGELG